MNIHGIEFDSMLNGDGLRAVVWVAGCSHKCCGCQNPQTWDPESGKAVTEQDVISLLEYLEKDYVSGVTFSGGDPLYPDNRESVEALCKLVKEKIPQKTVWMYTGYLYEQVSNLPLMQYVDVLVDGPFVKKLADVNYPWAGSTNQRVIHLKNGGLDHESDV